MSVEQVKAKVKGSIWQAIAQSGVDLSTLTAEQQSTLVDRIAENVLVSVNSALDEENPRKKAAAIPGDDDVMEEQILWEGRPFLSLVEHYTLTTDRLKIVRGMLSRDVENFELIRVQDIDVSQALSERMFNIGDITIKGADASSPVVVLRNIPDPQQVYELLRRAWLAARKRHGLVFREEM